MSKKINVERRNFETIVDTLEEASNHLNYCNYGDKWERECARHSGLENKISDALGIGRSILK